MLTKPLVCFLIAWLGLSSPPWRGERESGIEEPLMRMVLDEEDHASFLEDWFEEREFAVQVRFDLMQYDRRMVKFLRDQHRKLSGFRKALHKDPAKLIVERDKLLDTLIGELVGLISEQRKKGDPRKMVFVLREMVYQLRGGGALPAPLSALYEPGRRAGQRVVTVQGEEETLKTVSFGAHEYALVPVRAYWAGAREWCEERGGYLACIETREELEFVARELLDIKAPWPYPRLDTFVPYNYNYWVGASDSAEEGVWRWLHGGRVDLELFHRGGVVPQPSNFKWGEHHAGIVLHQLPEDVSPRVGLISWNGSSISRGGICEWGRTPLPEPWNILSSRQVEKILLPYWEGLSNIRVEEEKLAARVWKTQSRVVKKSRESFEGGIAKLRGALLRDFEVKRKELIKLGLDQGAQRLDAIIQALEAGSLEPDLQHVTRDGMENSFAVSARAFGRSYVFVQEPMTLPEAEAYCERLGGHLPQPGSRVGLSLLAHVLKETEGKSESWLARRFSRQWREKNEEELNWIRSELPLPGDHSGIYEEGLYMTGSGEGMGVSYFELRRPFLCVIEGYVPPVHWAEVTVAGVNSDLRGLSVVDGRTAWCGGSEGTLLRTTDGGKTWASRPVPGGEDLDFRSICALNADRVWVASAGPGEASRIYHTEDGGESWTLQYTNQEAAGSFGSIAFWDERRGLLLGDQVGGRLTILRTGDGGSNWTRVPADKQPQSPPGECVFSESGTSIALPSLRKASSKKAWIGTGGSISRIMASADGGKSWKAYGIPVGDDAESSGVFSLSTLDGLRGFAVGGDDSDPDGVGVHFARSEDGGITWRAPSRKVSASPSGFRSCVIADPTAKQRVWFAVGPTGSDISLDGGLSWQPVGHESLNSVGLAPEPDGGTGFAVGPAGLILRLELVE